MQKHLRPLIPFFILILTGAGCLGSSSSSGSDGAVWRTSDNGSNWTQLSALPSSSGVGSIAGVNVTSIEIDPNDSSVYYIGTESNGLFYTYDDGTTWQRPEDDRVRSGEVLDIEVSADNICTLYALKSDRILKSNTCGREWESVYSETRSDEHLTAIVIDWYDPENVWVGSTAGDILKTENAGSTWSTLYRINDEITGFLVSNGDSRIVLVGTEGNGIFRTEDGGSTWAHFEDDLKDNFKNSHKIYGFAQNKSGSTIVLNSKYGLLTSSDKGATWDDVDLLTAGSEVRIWSVAIDPNNGKNIYYATEEIFYTTTSGGDAWQTEDIPSARAPKSMIVHPASTDYVLVGFAAEED